MLLSMFADVGGIGGIGAASVPQTMLQRSRKQIIYY